MIALSSGAGFTVGGDSVGGCLAAIVARRGRDHGTPFATQLLVYRFAPEGIGLTGVTCSIDDWRPEAIAPRDLVDGEGPVRAPVPRHQLLERVGPRIEERLRQGGRLVYATCSVLPRENEDRIENFLSRDARYQRQQPDFHATPASGDGDGFYVSVLARG